MGEWLSPCPQQKFSMQRYGFDDLSSDLQNSGVSAAVVPLVALNRLI
jgi:hypothetical protein